MPRWTPVPFSFLVKARAADLAVQILYRPHAWKCRFSGVQQGLRHKLYLLAFLESRNFSVLIKLVTRLDWHVTPFPIQIPCLWDDGSLLTLVLCLTPSQTELSCAPCCPLPSPLHCSALRRLAPAGTGPTSIADCPRGEASRGVAYLRAPLGHC